MHEILHIFGLCADNKSHLDLIDLLIGGSATAGLYSYIKYYYSITIFYIKNKLQKND